jgi:hypothetical protein
MELREAIEDLLNNLWSFLERQKIVKLFWNTMIIPLKKNVGSFCNGPKLLL